MTDWTVGRMKFLTRLIATAFLLTLAGQVLRGYAAAAPVPPLPPAPPSGAAAIAALGSDLSAVAAKNHMSAEQLRRVLLKDSSIKVYANQDLVFVDNPKLGAPLTQAQMDAVAHEPQAIGPQWAGGAYTDATTFRLHSKPGSPLTIYLDFNGETVSGTPWNVSIKQDPVVFAPFDLDKKPSKFSTLEKAMIGQIWAGVAETFSSWDVDVTTQQPPLSDIVRADERDARYGIRVITTRDDYAGLCQHKCAGIAATSSFGHSIDTPTFNVAPKYPVKDQALVIAHEVGHTLGLLHDGTARAEYYAGANGWSPIMGGGYNLAVNQWSKGEYAGANNLEDDLAIIAQTLPVEPDEFPDTLEGAIELPAIVSKGLIATTADRDWSSFTFKGGNLAVSVRPAKIGTLKVAAELWRNDKIYKKILAVAMGAAITVKNAPAGRYQLLVTSVGTSAYSIYGSIGQYVVVLEGRFTFKPASEVRVVASSNLAEAGSQVSFSLTATNDIEAYADGAEWSFSDGTTATGSHPSVTMPNEPLSVRVSVPTMIFRNDGYWNAWTGTAGCPPGGVLIDILTGLCGYSGGPPSSARGLVGLASSVRVNAAFDSTTVVAGKPVRFSYSAVDPEYRDMRFDWSFSDGRSGSATTEGSFLVTPLAPGVFSVTLTVTTADGVSASSTASMTVIQRQPPVVYADCIRQASAAPAVIEYWAYGSDAGPVSFSWQTDDGRAFSGERIRVPYTDAGDKAATVTVTGFTGAAASKTLRCTLEQNLPPTLHDAWMSASSWGAPTNVAFDVSASDPNYQDLSYRWEFSDGRSSTTERTVMAFSTPGSYQATVTVSDPGGLYVSRTLQFTIWPNQAPSVAIRATTSTTQTAPALFALSGLGSDPEAQPLTYSWVFSDGTTSSLREISRAFTTASVVTATVTVTDPGGLTAMASITLTTVANQAPVISVASVSLQSGAAGTPRLFSVMASDPDQQALAYLWTFADGTTAKVPSITKTFSTRGTFQATVTVTDPGGLTATQTVTYVVT